MVEFAGKRVLVTGGASGIGLAQVQAFLKAGAQVFAVDKHQTKEVGDLAEYGRSSFLFYQADVSKEEEVQKLKSKIGQVDILLNTAGVLDGYQWVEKTSLASWEMIFANNVTSQFLLTKYFLPEMIDQAMGVVINMASVAGFVSGGGGVAYTASKHAIVGFTKQLAVDCASRGVRVYGIAPGAIETPMNAADFAGDGEMAKKVAEETPVHRWAKPSEVADVTLFLASEKASYMQGAIVPIDGGWMLK